MHQGYKLNGVFVHLGEVGREGGREVPLPDGLAGYVEARLFPGEVFEAGEGGRQGGREAGKRKGGVRKEEKD